MMSWLYSTRYLETGITNKNKIKQKKNRSSLLAVFLMLIFQMNPVAGCIIEFPGLFANLWYQTFCLHALP